MRARCRGASADRRERERSPDVLARVRSSEGACGAPESAAPAWADPQPASAARLGSFRPQRGSAHHAPAQEDRARSRASEIHQDHTQRRLHLRTGRSVRMIGTLRTKRWLCVLACIAFLLPLSGCMREPDTALRIGTNVWIGSEPLYLAREL